MEQQKKITLREIKFSAAITSIGSSPSIRLIVSTTTLFFLCWFVFIYFGDFKNDYGTFFLYHCLPFWLLGEMVIALAFLSFGFYSTSYQQTLLGQSIRQQAQIINGMKRISGKDREVLGDRQRELLLGKLDCLLLLSADSPDLKKEIKNAYREFCVDQSEIVDRIIDIPDFEEAEFAVLDIMNIFYESICRFNLKVDRAEIISKIFILGFAGDELDNTKERISKYCIRSTQEFSEDLLAANEAMLKNFPSFVAAARIAC